MKTIDPNYKSRRKDVTSHNLRIIAQKSVMATNKGCRYNVYNKGCHSLIKSFLIDKRDGKEVFIDPDTDDIYTSPDDAVCSCIESKPDMYRNRAQPLAIH